MNLKFSNPLTQAPIVTCAWESQTINKKQTDKSKFLVGIWSSVGI